MPKLDIKMMEHCAHTCHECQDACLTTAVHCLELGGEHASLEHQTGLADCAAICGLVHSFMHRRSPHATHLCGECAEICRACADSCDRVGHGDAEMERCAQICRRCARECEQMAGAAV
jgi:hypothetical protein